MLAVHKLLRNLSKCLKWYLIFKMIKIGWPSFPIFSPWYLWRTFQRYLNVRDSSKERRKIRFQTFHTSLESKEIRKCFITKKCFVSRSCKAIWVSDNSNVWRPFNKSSHTFYFLLLWLKLNFTYWGQHGLSPPNNDEYKSI